MVSAQASSIFPVPRAEYLLHSTVPAADDECTPTEQSTSGVAFTVYGQVFSGYFACSNGVVSFRDSYTDYSPAAFPVSSNVPIVAPFWADVDLSTCNFLQQIGCSYHAHYTGAAASVIDERIQNEFGYPSFIATGAIVQTWDQVGYYNAKTDLRNTFQAIVVTNQVETFACFFYDQIEWVSGSSVYAPAQCGFDAGDGLNEVTIPGSRTESVRDFEGNSYCFRVSDEVICPSGEIRHNGVCVPAGCSYFPNQISGQEALGAGVIGPSSAGDACNASGVPVSGDTCTLACESGYQPTFPAAGANIVATCLSGSYRFFDDEGVQVDPSVTALCQPVEFIIVAPEILEAYEIAALQSRTAPVAISLTSPPTGKVVVTITPSDTSEVTASPQNITFTTDNYNEVQQVAVVAIDDGVRDGDVAWNLTIRVAQSAEALSPQPYAMLRPVIISGITFDAEGITIARRALTSSTDAHRTSESDKFGYEYFDLALSGAPAANTTVICSSSNVGEGIVTTASEGQASGTIVFTSDSWAEEVRVFVKGVDDDIVDGSIVYNVSCVASSDCTSDNTTTLVTCFNGATSSVFSLINLDDDQLGVVVDMTSSAESYINDLDCSAAMLESCPMTPAGCGSMVLVQGAGPASVSVALSSKPASSSAVVQVSAAVEAVTTDATDKAIVEAAVVASSATFDAENWNIPQQISFQAERLASNNEQPLDDVALVVTFSVNESSTSDPGFRNGIPGYSGCANGSISCFSLKYGASADVQEMCGVFETNYTRAVVEEGQPPDDTNNEPDDGLPQDVLTAIIGGVLGFVILVILIVLIIACEREKKIRRQREQEARAKSARLDAADDMNINFRIEDEDDLDIDHLSDQLNEVQQRLLAECAKLRAENDVLATKVGEAGIGSTMEDTVDPQDLVKQIKKLKVDNDRLRELAGVPPRPPRKKVRNKKSNFGQEKSTGADEVSGTDSSTPRPPPREREYEMTNMRQSDDGNDTRA